MATTDFTDKVTVIEAEWLDDVDAVIYGSAGNNGIDNVVIGGTTPAAGSFTTVTTSGIVSVDDTTESTSPTTGSIHTDGGLGVAKDAHFGGTATFDAGQGCVFNGDSIAAANTLDDYEEGTWDAILSSGGSTTATMEPARTTMRYTKIGRMVHVQGAFAIDDKGDMGAGDQVEIQGLPFTAGSDADSSERSVGLLLCSGVTFAGEITCIILASTTTALLRESVSGGSAIIVPTSDLTTTADFYLSLTYST